ncbi:MAG: 2'-5' RNA ligase family protein [Pseudobutyrivibrio sp.]|nr:2'-5' RNA ligase family protein [Pseudobutyrivibrio sp.]
MYLISAYFDENTSNILSKYFEDIAAATGNDFMIANNVPPHMTITSIEARNPKQLIGEFERICSQLSVGDIALPTIGQLLPYVIYVGSVLNEYLQELQEKFYYALKDIPDTSISKYYMPYSWMPHITVGKTLSEGQMLQAFEYMQKSFAPVSGKIVELGLAKTNPHEDLMRIKLPVN